MESAMSQDKYLLPEEDGLLMRDSQDYARYKLEALRHYITMTNTSMRDKQWRERFYIDLQAGPGKNRIGSTITLGSPLIALTTEYPFTQYRLNERGEEENSALRQRISASPLNSRTQVYQQDVNQVVEVICGEIDAVDAKRLKGKWPCLNVAFLDPEGLELHWSTVARLAQVNRMDLIINFSTGGIRRSYGRSNLEAIDHFFGNTIWRDVMQSGDPTNQRRGLINLYRGQLQQFGYYVDVDPDLGSHDLAMRNSKNTEVYSLIFASKHELGDKFWRQAGKSTQPPKLPGF
jgi:three-Cys-motif partner protein